MSVLKYSSALFSKTLLVIVLIGAVNSCSTSPNQSPCTLSFLFYEIKVLTPEGEPADSVKISVINKETGKEYEDLCQAVYGDDCDLAASNGVYVIFHDGISDKEEISDEGEVIIVKGTKENLSFTEEFVFRFDGCHIRKVSGPDSVTLQ